MWLTEINKLSVTERKACGIDGMNASRNFQKDHLYIQHIWLITAFGFLIPLALEGSESDSLTKTR
jgi:hypothetical protein